MDKDKIRSYLESASAKAAAENTPDHYMGIPVPGKGGSVGAGTKLATKMLSVKETHREAEPKEKDSYQAAYQNAKNALIKSGEVLEEDESNGTIIGTVFAGVQDMNPAVLVIDVEQEKLNISAYAKEGIINQHTSDKAIEKFVEAL